MPKVISKERRYVLIEMCHITIYGLIADCMRMLFRGNKLNKIDDLVEMSITGMLASGFDGTEKVRLYNYKESELVTVEEFWKKSARFRANNFLTRALMYNEETGEIIWPVVGGENVTIS